MMNIFDNMLLDLKRNEIEIWGKYTKSEKNKIDKWNQRIGIEDASHYILFRDVEFVKIFLKKISDEEEQYRYFENTYKYFINDRSYNSDYVLFTRRSLYPKVPKPESFWTSEHREVLCGLKNEIPEGTGQREYSVIMVTTLSKLINHGLSYTDGGSTDGEVVIDPNKVFTDFFFYKPEREILKLNEYKKHGGKTYEQVFEELRENAEERKKRQGFGR